MTVQVQFTGKFISIILLIKFSQSLNLSCNHPIPVHHHYTYPNNLISSLPNDTSFDVDCIGSFPPWKLDSDVTIIVSEFLWRGPSCLIAQPIQSLPPSLWRPLRRFCHCPGSFFFPGRLLLSFSSQLTSQTLETNQYCLKFFLLI